MCSVVVKILVSGEIVVQARTSEVAPGDDVEGSLTFELPSGTRVDALIWAPERDVTYSLALQN